jgi:hypothetical protein
MYYSNQKNQLSQRLSPLPKRQKPQMTHRPQLTHLPPILMLPQLRWLPHRLPLLLPLMLPLMTQRRKHQLL